MAQTRQIKAPNRRRIGGFVEVGFGDDLLLSTLVQAPVLEGAAYEVVEMR